MAYLKDNFDWTSGKEHVHIQFDKEQVVHLEVEEGNFDTYLCTAFFTPNYQELSDDTHLPHRN